MNLTARVRALPITPPPMSGETIGSFLHRLADDNRTTDGWPPEALPRLAALTGRNVLTLQHALPALRTVGTNAPSHPRANIPNRPVRLACRLCAARRGAHGVVLRRTADHECVCPTHQRWLNTGEQLGLTALPEVLQANKRHRRIPRGHDTDYLQAAQLTSGWYFQTDGPPELRHRWDRRLAALPTDPFGDPYRPSHARVELVAYPESVTLASLFASAHWQESDLLPAEAGRRLGIPCPVQAKMTSRRAIDLKSVILTWTIWPQSVRVSWRIRWILAAERLLVEVVADGKRDVLEGRLIRVALDALRIENQQLRDALAHVHGQLRAARTDLDVEEGS